MHDGRAAANGAGLGGAASAVAERMRAIVRLEAELAVAELAGKAKRLAAGGVLLAAGGVTLLLGTGLLLAGIAAAIAIVLPWWAALLVLAGGVLGLGGLLGAAGVILLRAGAPPVPRTAIAEARTTLDELAGVS